MYEGSRIQNSPHMLESLFRFAERVFLSLDPLWSRMGYDFSERLIKGPEDLFKKPVFGCHECGQCILHYTGMTCPMTCPKQLRNGPCGGVRMNGHCEVDETEECVWHQAYNRSRRMPIYGQEILDIQPMLDYRREETSAWINMLREEEGEIPRADPEKLELDKMPPMEK